MLEPNLVSEFVRDHMPGFLANQVSFNIAVRLTRAASQEPTHIAPCRKLELLDGIPFRDLGLEGVHGIFKFGIAFRQRLKEPRNDQSGRGDGQHDQAGLESVFRVGVRVTLAQKSA